MDSGTGTIETVLFDYGGVLAEEGFRGGLYAIAQLNECDAETFYEEVVRIIADCGYLTGRGDEAAFWNHVRQECGIRQADALLRNEILRRFVLRPAMLAVAARLRAGGLQVGIISDQTNWLDELDRRDGFFVCFDRVFNSYHLQASKHQGGLFDAVAGQLQAEPAQILIVDDNPGNIEKARQRDFAAILYKNKDGFLREMLKLFPNIFGQAYPYCV